MRIVRLLRFNAIGYMRNPTAVYFAFALPLILLPVTVSLIGGLINTAFVSNLGTPIDTSEFYTVSILAFAIITATFAQLAVDTTTAREEGVLKRIRSTSAPSWHYLASKVVFSLLMMSVMSAVVLLFSLVVYGVRPPAAGLPALIVSIGVGAICMSILGLAMSSVIPNVGAAIPMTNAVLLPLCFISGTFTPTTTAPDWLVRIGDVFPVKAFNDALSTAMLTSSSVDSWALGDLGVMAAWGAAGVGYCLVRFRWLPGRTG